MSITIDGALGDGRRSERLSTPDWLRVIAASAGSVGVGILFSLVMWGINHG
jgi:hypothetical protein